MPAVAHMAEEGVIQFHCELSPRAQPVAREALASLVAWRDITTRLELIGQVPGRYGGYAFGNLSERRSDGFEISASQSAHMDGADPDAWAHVTAVDVERFALQAEGARSPSSESITHAMLYAADARIGAVIHVHSPVMWLAADALDLPTTAADIPYGTPELGAAVSLLLADHPTRPLTFATLGHEDGIFTVGPDLHTAGGQLLADYARALATRRAADPNDRHRTP